MLAQLNNFRINSIPQNLLRMKLLCLSLLLFAATSFSWGKSVVVSGKWKVSYDRKLKGVHVEKDAKLLFSSVYASYKFGDKLVTTKEYASSSAKVLPVSDGFGKGSVLEITYKDKALPVLVQSFYLYPDRDYVLTDFTVLGHAKEVTSNYMAPVNIDRMMPLLAKGDNRALFVPFDNDCWVRYQSYPLTFDKLRSYEVSAIFQAEDRNGLVIGSVEHSDWKTAVDMSGGDASNIGSLVCYGGVADSLTRDSKAHGPLKGNKIKSPKIFIGFFDDWRAGLDEYGKANAVIAPVKKDPGAVTFGWNSWGALQFNLTYKKALEVSDFFKSNLQNNHFINPDNTVIIGLDSGWNSFTEAELKDFVDRCTANGQLAGVYWTPFTDWGRDPEREMGDAPGYKFKDVYLYANGQPQNLDGAYAIDPTHPAAEEQMKKISALFHRAGFKYVKMDFMTHGAMEADTWFNPEITTGIQAYNYGMKLLDTYFGDMYMNLSISPAFPAHYANSRRIACDAWNKIKDTEYTLNALSYGWWLNHVYQYNDADHIVLRDATEGENRARVTSGVITGLYIVGDDFSEGGKQEDKQKAMKFLTNQEVNAVAKGRSFAPVEGNGERSESQFVLLQENGSCYYAIFNYTDEITEMNVSLDRIGLDPSKVYQVKELWTGSRKEVKDQFKTTIPPKDVLLYKID